MTKEEVISSARAIQKKYNELLGILREFSGGDLNVGYDRPINPISDIVFELYLEIRSQAADEFNILRAVDEHGVVNNFLWTV